MGRGTAGKVPTFGAVPRVDIPRSTFDRSHRHLTTMDADYLVPILCDPVLPGDSYSVMLNIFARLATPLFPIMDNMYLDTFFFFVPNRLVWDNWEKFCGAQDDPADSIDFTIPVAGASTGLAMTGGAADQLKLYMGLPPGTVDLSTISALPFRGYNLIYNEWFRDQNLQDSLTVDTGNGPDTHSNYALVKRGKRHDYFTSCLPWPQKQTTAVELPIGGTVDVRHGGTESETVVVYSVGESDYRELYAPSPVPSDILVDTNAGADQNHKLYVDLTTTTSAVDINDFRLAYATQRLLERDARSGTRYVETVLAHYGVTVPDFRVQRPEYLGGGSSPVNVTPVAQTTYQGTPTDEDAKGALAGFGTVSGSHGFTKSFVEHGYIIGLANVRADITYSQGVDRDWTKSTRYDIYYPVLAGISEQSVLAGEIYNAAASKTAVFGYQERHAEYRYKNSRLSGLMAVDEATNLAPWHLSEDFASEPVLNAAFIESNLGTPLDRAIAVNTEPHFICDFYFQMKCARPMPTFGIPGNLDRF